MLEKWVTFVFNLGHGGVSVSLSDSRSPHAVAWFHRRSEKTADTYSQLQRSLGWIWANLGTSISMTSRILVWTPRRLLGGSSMVMQVGPNTSVLGAKDGSKTPSDQEHPASRFLRKRVPKDRPQRACSLCDATFFFKENCFH